MVEFKKVKLREIFDIRRGGRVTRAKQKPGKIPYVTAVTTNNGVDTYISNPKFTDSNILTANFFGNVFYQPNEVGYKDGTYGLKLKEGDKRRRRVYLYLASSIEKVSLSRGGYSNGLIAKDFEEMEVEIPVTPEGEVDYEYMENYIKEIEQKYVSKLKSDLEIKIKTTLEVIGRTELTDDFIDQNREEESRVPELLQKLKEDLGFERREYKVYKLTDIFSKEEIVRGKRITTTNRIEGETPLITAGKDNYGVAQRIKTHSAKSEGHVVTIDMFGNCFYRDYDFYFDDNIIVFSGNNRDKGIMKYIASALFYLPQMYGYGNQFRYKEISKVSVKIPVTPEGIPDYDFMDKYIAYIELTHTHTSYRTEQERIGNIEELIR